VVSVTLYSSSHDVVFVSSSLSQNGTVSSGCWRLWMRILEEECVGEGRYGRLHTKGSDPVPTLWLLNRISEVAYIVMPVVSST